MKTLQSQTFAPIACGVSFDDLILTKFIKPKNIFPQIFVLIIISGCIVLQFIQTPTNKVRDWNADWGLSVWLSSHSPRHAC